LNICNHTNVTTDVNISFPVTLQQTAPNLAVLKGTGNAAAYSLTFQVSAGATTLQNSLVMTDDSDVPYYCGLDSRLFASAFGASTGTPIALGQGSGSQSTAAIVLAVLAVVAAGVAAWFFGNMITSRLAGMSDKAVPINLGFQVLLFALSAAAAGGQWAAGNGYTLSLWSLCGPLATGQGCMSSSMVSTAGLGSFALYRRLLCWACSVPSFACLRVAPPWFTSLGR